MSMFYLFSGIDTHFEDTSSASLLGAEHRIKRGRGEVKQEEQRAAGRE